MAQADDMAASLADLKKDISDEVSAILAADFAVTATTTQYVPHSGDPAITFPNLDAGTIKTKILESCVLYVDIRRSTELNLHHKPHTVSKLYSAFVRAMTRCAQHNNGHVRGIIGDRVLVLFDAKDCFVNAVETAQSMNSVAQYVVNKHFKANEVSCGIGIDYGRMLVTKTGFRRHGHEQQNYRSLVWLGRPANIASKLTDLAGKPRLTKEEPVVHVAQTRDPNAGLGALAGLGLLSSTPNALLSGLAGASSTPNFGDDWEWRDVSLKAFMEGFEKTATGQWTHKLPRLQTFFLTSQVVTVRPATPTILMTKSVYDGYKAAKPDSAHWYKEYAVYVPGRPGKIYGGDIHWKVFSDGE